MHDGQPKGVVRDNGGHLVALKWTMKNVYDVDPGDVFWAPRTDDIINVAGHRLSTGGVEEVLASHQDVAECAVVGVHDDLKGEIPVGFLVLEKGVDRDPHEILAEVVQMARQKIGPVAAFKTAVVVPALPKTRSGKVLRRYDAENWRRKRLQSAGHDRTIPVH